MEIENTVYKGASCVLIEGPRWADCKFYARWLLAAAQAERLWTEALAENAFKHSVESLCIPHLPSFEIGACVMLMRLEQGLSTAIVKSGSEEELEFAMMVSLGFFRLTGQRYQMTIPKRLTSSQVKRAASALARTEDEDWLHPEKLIVTMSLSDAAAWQDRLHSIGEDHRMADRAILLEDAR